MVLWSVGWDMKESPESNLHVCGKDNPKIAVYNMKKCTEKRDRYFFGTIVQFLFGRKPYETNNLVCFEDKFDNLIWVKPS